MNIQKFQRSSVFAKNHKLHAVNPGSISGRFFLSAHCRCGVLLDSALMQESFLTLFAFPGYTVYTCIYFSKSPSPLAHHPFTTSEMVGPTDLGKHAYFISFVTQHMLHVSVTGKMPVICIRNFVTYTGLMKTSIKVTYTDLRGLWAMRFSDISGHRTTEVFGSVSYCQRLRVNYNFPVFVSESVVKFNIFLVEGCCSLNSNKMSQ